MEISLMSVAKDVILGGAGSAIAIAALAWMMTSMDLWYLLNTWFGRGLILAGAVAGVYVNISAHVHF